MAWQIVPGRFSQQPQNAAPINGGNPNARGLSFVALPGNGRFIDLLNVVTALTVTGTPTASSGLGGTAVEFGGSAKIDINVSGTNSFTNGFTVTAVFVPKNSGVKGTILTLTGASSAFQIARNASNGIAVDKQQAANIFSTGSLGLTAGVLATVSISFINNTRYACSVNGRIVASGVYNWGADAGNLVILGGRQNDASEALTGSILGAFIHNYAVTDAPLNDLSANPWQLLRAPPRRIWMASAGGATDTPINPGVGALSLTGYAPTISQPQAVAPDVGTVAITGYAPTVTQGLTTNIVPGAGSLTLNGFAPSIAQSVNQVITSGVGSLAISGYAPALAQTVNQNVLPAAGALVITGYAPVVTQQSASPSLTPGTGQITITGYEPTITQSGSAGRPRRKFQVETSRGIVEVETLDEVVEVARAEKRTPKAKNVEVKLAGIKVSTPSLKPNLDYQAIEDRMRAQVQAEIDDEEELLLMML